MQFEKLLSRFTKKQSSLQNGEAASDVEPSISNALSAESSVPDHKRQSGLILLNREYVKSSIAMGTYDLDIVAVHGISGDAFKSWTHANNKHWLRDFLPDAFPGARVYTFGYPAEVFWSKSDGNIDSFARSLLEGIKRERRSSENWSRRTIFICHSMGGIVVKKALTIARIDNDDYGEIRSSVSAILFLGTPHHGTGFASLMKFPMQVARTASLPIVTVTGNTRRDLMKNLEKGAETLQEISKNFRNSMNDIKIASFIEKSFVPPLKKVIVDESTGTMGIPGERIVPMHGCDHRTICRFDAVSSPGYLSILEVLQDWAEGTKETEFKEFSAGDKSCLRSLAFPEMGYRRSDADRAYPNTCGWILQHASYKAWLEMERGLLWIKGKPGAGKSTLLAFIYRKFQGRLSNRTDLTLEFFFHGRGAALQKSSLGMFRSLLHQLYYEDLTTRRLILAAFHRKEILGEADKDWDWQLSELQNLFSECIIAATKSRKIIIFIDALDESGSDAHDLVTYLHELNDKSSGTNSGAALCISCRHYPVTAKIPGMDVRVEDNNQDDIAYYVQAKLQMNSRKDNNNELQSEAWTKIEKQIVSNASGVFQWARLVVSMVIDYNEDGYPWCEIHEKLAKVPRELGAVYEHILNKVIKLERRQETLHLIQWVYLAERPLTIEELAHAMAFDDAHISSSLYSYKDAMEYLEKFEKYEKILKLVNSLSGGLAEVKYHENKSVVQFIHQSVNDFLYSTGLNLIVSEIAKPSHTENSQSGQGTVTDKMLGQGHDRISRSCINYLRLAIPEVDWKKIMPDLGAKQFSLPFIDYATRYWIVHAAKSEKHGISQQHLSSRFDCKGNLLRNWIRIYTLEAVYQRNSSADMPALDQATTGMTLLHLASNYNLRSTVQELLKEGISLEARDESGARPLHYAARRGHKAIVRMLLAAHADPGPKDENGFSPMEYAAENGHQEVVKLLLRSHADIINGLQAAVVGGSISIVRVLLDIGADLNAAGDQKCTPLQEAARQGHIRMVQFLVENGAKIDLRSNEYASALQAAAEHGHDDIFQYLLDHGANINLQGGQLGNALQAAAVGGTLNMLKQLLNRGVEVNAQGGQYGTALLAASLCRHSEAHHKVLLLVKNGANVNADGGLNGNPLHAACYAGNPATIALLIEKGAKVNARGGRYRYPLHAACEGGHPDIIALLIENGAKVNDAAAGGTALQLAAHSGKNDIIELLLKHGADINAPASGYWGTALQAALRHRAVMTVKLLLENGANVNAQSEQFGAPLQTAACELVTENVMLLLANGAEINAQSGLYGTALQGAARTGNTEVVKLLIEKGADIHIRGGYYETALQAAAAAGWGFENERPITILLDHGADVDVNVQGGRWGNAIQAAIREGDMNTVYLLLKHGAILDPQDKEFSRSLLKDKISEQEIEELLRRRGYPIRYPGTYLTGEQVYEETLE